MVESVSGCVNSMDLTWQVRLILSPTTNHVHSATCSPPSVTAYINIPPGSLFSSQTLPINLWSMTPVLATHTWWLAAGWTLEEEWSFTEIPYLWGRGDCEGVPSHPPGDDPWCRAACTPPGLLRALNYHQLLRVRPTSVTASVPWQKSGIWICIPAPKSAPHICAQCGFLQSPLPRTRDCLGIAIPWRSMAQTLEGTATPQLTTPTCQVCITVARRLAPPGCIKGCHSLVGAGSHAGYKDGDELRVQQLLYTCRSYASCTWEVKIHVMIDLPDISWLLSPRDVFL